MKTAKDKDISNPIKIKFLIPQIIVVIGLMYFIIVQNVFETIIQSFSMVIFSVVIIYILDPLVKIVERVTKQKKSISVLLAMMLAIVGIMLVFISIIPALVDSIVMMANALPPAIQEFTNSIKQIEGQQGILGLNYEISQIVDNIVAILYSYVDVLIDMVASGVKSATLFTTAIFSSIFNVIFVVMMAWYGLLESDNMIKQIKRFMYVVLKKENADYVLHAVKVGDKTFKGYFVSKAFICAILSVIIFITIIIANAVSSLYIPYATLFSVFLGITNFIPYIGPIIGAIPCIIITLILNGMSEAIVLTLIIVIIQQLESMFLTPKIMKNSLGVNEFGVVASASVGGALFGLTGMVISIPVVATLQTLISEFVDKREKKS